MAILHHRYPAPERSVANVVGALTHASPCIQSWYSSVQNVFKEYMMVSPVSHLPILYVPLYTHVSMQVMIGIGSYGLTDDHTFYDWKTFIRSNIKNLLQKVREGNENKTVVVSKELINSPGEIIELEPRHFIQLSASLLNLYKDVLESEICLIEKHKLARLKAGLENLPSIRMLAEIKEDGNTYHALKEMVLGMRECGIYRKECEEGSGTGLTKDLQEKIFKMMCFLSRNTLERYEKDISRDQCTDWLMGLSEDHFIQACVILGKYLPGTILDASLRAQSTRTIINILKTWKSCFVLVLPLDLLQKALREMSGSDIHELFMGFSVKELVGILIDLPQCLLENILLELPEDMVCCLKKEIIDGDLKKQMQESLIELKMAYDKTQTMLIVEERVLPSLGSIAAGVICQSPQRTLVGLGRQALSETSVERILLISPSLQEEVYSQLRVRVNVPIVDNSPEFTLVEPQSPGYKPELDLLSLASLVPGYESVLKKTLLEKCSNN